MAVIIESLRCGSVRSYHDGTRVWTSPIAKQPVDGSVRVDPLGLEGDQHEWQHGLHLRGERAS
jgi:hypothetical protein